MTLNLIAGLPATSDISDARVFDTVTEADTFMAARACRTPFRLSSWGRGRVIKLQSQVRFNAHGGQDIPVGEPMYVATIKVVDARADALQTAKDRYEIAGEALRAAQKEHLAAQREFDRLRKA